MTPGCFGMALMVGSILVALMVVFGWAVCTAAGRAEDLELKLRNKRRTKGW